MNVIETYKDVEKVLKKDFVMIIAKSHTCSACKSILGMLEQNVPNLDNIEIQSVYIDDMDQFRGEHLIFSVPTVLIFSKGKELLRESRYINYSKVTRLIDIYTS
ncbi:Thioredoxin-like protein YtpP [Candidatus Izimaplasma bacterium HR1]|jgi:thiol-disulfide isomerase/thioredoxin|uniref:thioredoxin family protein n=1 Tax=Candidatus Izimoplasma sp. HR1 TaxID=1541959 RepID=UPI0004F7B196|nr:Thioredoxin-like protein YtpP [Candidatus Izimaplasma bacterium HR1]